MSEELIDVSFVKRHEIVQAIRNAESLDKAVILMNGYAANGWLHLWDNAKHPDGSSVQSQWQSSQQSTIDRLTEQHKADDKRIADLLAVIERKDEALEYYANKRNWSKDSQEYGSEVSDYNVMWDDFQEINQATKQAGKRAIEALALTADGVELVEVGYIGTESMEAFLTMGMPISPESCDEPVEKLYTIKQKP